MPQSVEIKRLMDTPQARACWLLQFCQRDLTQMTGQALEQLQSEWVEFQGSIWKGGQPPVRSRLIQWQQEVRGKLNELINGQRWVLECYLWRQLRIVDSQLHTQQRTGLLSPKEEPNYLIRVMDTLEAASDDLRLCAREKCRKMFVRTKRQAYCSARCRGTEGKRRYRKKKTKLP